MVAYFDTIHFLFLFFKYFPIPPKASSHAPEVAAGFQRSCNLIFHHFS
jgi:hypothetical protein